MIGSRRVQIKEALEKGLRNFEVAEQFGVSRAYVSNIKYDRDERCRLTQKQKLRIAFLWGADYCAPAIASEIGNIGVQRVINFLRDEGFINAQP